MAAAEDVQGSGRLSVDVQATAALCLFESLGFRPEGVLKADMLLPMGEYPDSTARRRGMAAVLGASPITQLIPVRLIAELAAAAWAYFSHRWRT